MAKVTLREVTKIFPPNTVAVQDVNLDIADGEFFTLLGPSGCGKTTTLRIIAGLETPTKGRVYIDDNDVTETSPKERDVAMVFQSWALYPHMKVKDNIAFPLKLRKVPKKERDRKIREIAKLLKIEDLLDRYPRQLSGGQQQRVALARALVREPKVWLLDEPLSNLDALLRVHMRAELKRLQREIGVTTVYVTHDQIEALTMADRIAVMNAGRVLQVGSAHEIYHRPSCKFVAGFIGTPPMNFIECSLIQKDDKYMLEHQSFRIELPKEMGEIIMKRASSSELILGVRPEDLKIVSEEEINTIPVEVYVCEPLGVETIVNVKIGDDIVKVKIPGEVSYTMGQRVLLKYDINKIHVFDKRTGRALI